MLYVYESKKDRKEMMEQFNDYHFVGIAFFLQDGDSITEIDDILCSDYFEHYIVDITNIIKDGNYYKVYTERLLYLLLNRIEDVHFCIKEKYLNDFIDWFPDFFQEDEIDKRYETIDETDQEKKEISIMDYSIPKQIYVYDKTQTIKDGEEKTIILISELIEKFEGIRIQYNIREIEKKLNIRAVDFVDISSLVQMVGLRDDLKIQIEIFLLHLVMVYKKNFCIKKDYVNVLEENFPYFFTEIIEMYDYMTEKQVLDGVNADETKPDIDRINKIADDVNSVLKGHDNFKKDFKHNLLKYSFLNNMRERRILSIMLCGESGIGKTEFAKILSFKLYPNESLIKINFGNYSTEGVLNSLIGSPLGYIGSGEGGELINEIARSKSKVILIDEFEKATPSVYNFFYELLEDGFFTDRHGKKHDLNGYIIVFTSNMTQAQYQKHIPDSLKSRFDMVYYFVDVPKEEKKMFIENHAKNLMDKLKVYFGKEIDFNRIKDKLEVLTFYKNLRDIKRKVEDIVFQEFFR